MKPLCSEINTLQSLENDDWGQPTNTTGLVKDCHRLRRKPLAQFTPGDCRLLLGQNISLEYLVPLALTWLSDNPFMEASYYHGDLLLSLLQIEPQFWQTHPHYWWEVTHLIMDAEFLNGMLGNEILPAAAAFAQNCPNQIKK
jgi:hypothetical protein